MHYAQQFDHMGHMNTRRNRYQYLFIAALVAMVICISQGIASQTEEPYLTVDPAGPVNTGDLLILSGTTSLAEGTDFLVKLEGAHFNTGGVVMNGTQGINRWSVPIDTRVIKPAEYRVNVTEIRGYNPEITAFIFGNVTGSTNLVITGTFLGSDTAVPAADQKNAFIIIDPIQDRKWGDQFIVTGSTNLSVGTDLIWEVRPNDPDLEITTSPNLTGSMGNSQVTRGTPANVISFAMDTTRLNPYEYNVSVSTIEGDIFSDDMIFGPVSDSVIFTIDK